MIVGVILLAIGIVYLAKPDIFNRWFWKRTDIAQRKLSPKRYVLYMRVLGMVLVVVGAWLVYASR